MASEVVDQEIVRPSLDVRDLSKTYAGNRALGGVRLQVARGEVHVLLGQNGSGKSTLIKVLSGYHAPDLGGEVDVDGAPLQFSSPESAHKLGCRFVQQDLGLLVTESIRDNVLLTPGGYPSRFGTIRGRQADALTRAALARVDVELDPRRLVSDLSASERTAVALARALREESRHPTKVLVLDEVTASLAHDETVRLLSMVRKASRTGVAILYVTHDLDEVFSVADRVSVLRDGNLIAGGAVTDFDRAGLTRLLAGELAREDLGTARQDSHPGSAALTAEGLTSGALRECSFSLPKGRIVGVAGLTGSGRDSLLGAVFGATERERGQVITSGVEIPAERPDLAVAKGLAYLPSDRKGLGGMMSLSARENITLPELRPFWRRGVMRRKLENEEVEKWFGRLDIRPSRPNALLATFSGGNQQKILLARWLRRAPKVMLLDDPTQGVDIGSKAQIHSVLRNLADDGTAVAMSSTDSEELATVCDRVWVMRGGRIATVIGDTSAVTADRIKRELAGAADA